MVPSFQMRPLMGNHIVHIALFQIRRHVDSRADNPQQKRRCNLITYPDVIPHRHCRLHAASQPEIADAGIDEKPCHIRKPRPKDHRHAYAAVLLGRRLNLRCHNLSVRFCPGSGNRKRHLRASRLIFILHPHRIDLLNNPIRRNRRGKPNRTNQVHRHNPPQQTAHPLRNPL